MNPFQHGECSSPTTAVRPTSTRHYERFIDESLHLPKRHHRLDLAGGAGQGCRGDHLGDTVQVIPHIINEIKDCILCKRKDDIDVVITGSAQRRHISPLFRKRSGGSARRSGDNVCYVRDPRAVHRPVG
jgi:CTP synthase (UTP-ammonia lyase)